MSSKDFKIDEQRKNLYSKGLRKKINSKSIYFYIYMPTQKATQSTQLKSKVLSNLKNSNIISLFSRYTFFNTYPIQGPRIHILLAKSLFFEKIKELQEISILICFLDLKWYAFFLLLEINSKYQFLFQLCFDLKCTIEISTMLLVSCQK